MRQFNRVLFYSKDPEELGIEPREMVGGGVSPERLEVFGSVNDLAARLCGPQCESALAVLHISDEEDMRNMLSIRGLLGDSPVFLILPDRSVATITAGHSLYPRYLGFKDEPLDDLRAVLSRMVETGGIDMAGHGGNGL
jgi:hypothetical protein